VQLRPAGRVVGTEARGQDHRPGLDLHGLVGLAVVDGLDRAGFGADAASLHTPLGLPEAHAVGAVQHRGVGQSLGEGDVDGGALAQSLVELGHLQHRRDFVHGLQADGVGGAHRLAGPALQAHLAAAVVGGVHPDVRPAAHEVGHSRAHALAADAHAQPAQDAVVLFQLEARGGNPVLSGQLADGLHLRAAGQEQLQAHAPALVHALRVGLHLQALTDLVVAGGHQALAPALGDLHHAQAAAAVGFQRGVVAQGGDLHSPGPGRFQDGLAGLRLHLGAVQAEEIDALPCPFCGPLMRPSP
jgi:hypothetical protein